MAQWVYAHLGARGLIPHRSEPVQNPDDAGDTYISNAKGLHGILPYATSQLSEFNQ